MFLDAASRAYEQILHDEAREGRLDADAPTVRRLRTISARLAEAAAPQYQESRPWRWEVHTSDDPRLAAFCIAGGKLLVGRPFIQRLALTDDELAMLLSHEMAHALLGHQRFRASEVSDDPAGALDAAASAIGQEDEADEIGLRLAFRAGFKAAALAGFFDKLALEEPAGTFSSTHRSATLRAQRAHELAAELAGRGAQKGAR